MCAGTDPNVIAVAPIDQIMPGLRAITGVVRDLVSRHAHLIADVLGHREHICTQIFVWQPTQLTAGITITECGALFDGKLIEGNMIDREGQSLF